MHILHIIPSLRRSAGGPSRSVQGLVAELNCAGVETWLMTISNGNEPWIEGVNRFINGETFENVTARLKPDIVHLHGLWNIELHRCTVICRRRHIPYVIAPRGMLEPWSLKQKWLKKRIARWLYQDRDLKCAAALHATAESEAEQFRRLGFKSPIIVSPNGVNVPNGFQFPVLTPARASPSATRFARGIRSPFPSAARRVLFVSRMHPKKGVLELVEAWNKIRIRDWKCELVYTVSGEFEKEYEAKIRARVNELGLQDQFVFTGALSDDEKWAAYARADLFVLPTYSENFGIVVAEALWAGVPVITTKGTPWKELEDRKCGKWIDLPAEGSNPSDWSKLVSALESMMFMSDDKRREMGERGRELVEEKYTWGAAVKTMVKGYESILK